MPSVILKLQGLFTLLTGVRQDSNAESLISQLQQLLKVKYLERLSHFVCLLIQPQFHKCSKGTTLNLTFFTQKRHLFIGIFKMAWKKVNFRKLGRILLVYRRIMMSVIEKNMNHNNDIIVY